MRVGFNPNKDQTIKITKGVHQIIIPLHIPKMIGYFKDCLTVFKLCLQSLQLTSHNDTFITVVSNACCAEVITHLNSLYAENKIQEVIHLREPGKLNAIIKGLVGHKFTYVTITDADVMFLNNWQKKTYSIFEAFPKAGVVCPTPSSKSYNTNTFNILFEKLFSSKLRFTEVENPKAMRQFAESIGNPYFYNNDHLSKYLTVAKHDVKAVVGAGHFAATYRADIFRNMEFLYSPYKLGGHSETVILDLPVVKKGFWRLSTTNNYARHMGNIYEEWMGEEFEKIVKNSESSNEMNLSEAPSSCFVFYKIMSKLMSYKLLRVSFLRFKGLNKIETKTY